ncbi:MAG TPA: hypothetical protein VFI24_14595 [Pyrinomonadaceae bacterium]|nr:hypothetical protein [Pyrinomonadaceae bacterium]
MKLILIMFLALLLLAMPSFAQQQGPIPPDFPTLQKVSIEELKLKTEGHVNIWGLDKILRWDMTQGSGQIVFSLPDGLKAVAPAQIIGTYNMEDHTWLWSWANSSIREELQVDARKVLKYGEEHHIERLTTRKWVGSEDDAWAMAAVAVKLCGEQGAYRGPSGSTHVFIAFGEVSLSKK